MSMKSLKRAVKDSRKDEFEVGTVIRWKMGACTFAALKVDTGTRVGWWTTATGSPRSGVAMVVSFDGLLEVLQGSGVSEVAVAASWEEV